MRTNGDKKCQKSWLLLMSRPYNFENIERFRDFPPKSYDSYSNWEKNKSQNTKPLKVSKYKILTLFDKNLASFHMTTNRLTDSTVQSNIILFSTKFPKKTDISSQYLT